MLTAVDDSGVRRTATPGAAAFCPACGHELVVRVPRRRVTHWAHKPGQKCDAAALRAARLKQRRETEKAARFAKIAQGPVDGQEALFDLQDADGPPEPANQTP